MIKYSKRKAIGRDHASTPHGHQSQLKARVPSSEAVQAPTALEGGIADQLAGVEHSAGVRRSL
jgi:hypothetical protein